MNKIYVLLKMASGSYIICEETEKNYLYLQHVHNPNKNVAIISPFRYKIKKDADCIDEVVRTSNTLDIEEFKSICMLEIL